MKYFRILPILLLSLACSFYACNDSADSRRREAPKVSPVATPGPATPAPAATPTPAPTAAEPAQNAAGVWHYTCSKGCAGGAGGAGTCATCGGPLAHNSAYHTNSSTNANANNTTTPQITPPTLPKTAEPAQNASGVWHYTCANGCAGGAGSAGPCSGCGGTLAHNAAYHQ